MCLKEELHGRRKLTSELPVGPAGGAIQSSRNKEHAVLSLTLPLARAFHPMKRIPRQVPVTDHPHFSINRILRHRYNSEEDRNEACQLEPLISQMKRAGGSPPGLWSWAGGSQCPWHWAGCSFCHDRLLADFLQGYYKVSLISIYGIKIFLPLSKGFKAWTRNKQGTFPEMTLKSAAMIIKSNFALEVHWEILTKEEIILVGLYKKFTHKKTINKSWICTSTANTTTLSVDVGWGFFFPLLKINWAFFSDRSASRFAPLNPPPSPTTGGVFASQHLESCHFSSHFPHW